MTNLETGDVVLCTVDRIAGTLVFVKIQGEGEGSIILSEIAPGRIRNLRDYVVPKKKIVCKVLRIVGDRIDLSLRRVTLKEQKEVLEQNKQEKSYKSVFKTILGDKSADIVTQIQKEERLFEFVEEIKVNPKKLESLVGKPDAEKILKILLTQKQKKAIVKKTLLLTSSKSEGLQLIKDILLPVKNAEVKYISAGKYSLSTEDKDLKTADSKLRVIIEDIEKQAKKQEMTFDIKDSKKK